MENYPKIKNIIIDENNKIEIILNNLLPNDIEYLKIYIGNNECIPIIIKEIKNINCIFNNNLYYGKYIPIIRSNFGNLLFEDNKIIELNINMKFISITYKEKNVHFKYILNKLYIFTFR